MIEEWRDIEGYEGYYQVSNLGRIKSLVREGRRKELILNCSKNTTGYLVVQLRKDNKRVSKLVHRLVLSAFEPCPMEDVLDVNHKDLDITNNIVSNLEWCDDKFNSNHYWTTADISKRKEGAKGEKHHLAKLTYEKAKEIRRLYSSGEITNFSEIARVYGVKEGSIRNIIYNKTWKSV